MHWLGDAAARAGIEGATTLLIPNGTSCADAWEIAVRALGTTPNDLAERIAGKCGLRPARFQGADPKAVRLIPEKIARRYGVFPLREDDRELTVATSDPYNIECEQDVAFAAGRRVVFVLASPHQIAQAINGSYATERFDETLRLHLDAGLADAVKIVEAGAPEVVESYDIETAPVVRLTNLILRDAVLQRASDIHIEPGEGHGVVRFRIDGVMRMHMKLPVAALTRVVSRIKILSRLDIANRMRPQDGKTRLEIDGKLVDLRVSTVPIRDAEKLVIRVLRPDASPRLDDIELAPVELERLRTLLAAREGIVLVTGPTGSGKTTTVYAALRELANGDINIMTVEDPVEYQLPSISQIQTDLKRGVTFASALRAILRQDPDVIFVGEIRDLETAEIAVQAAMTGHLVLATLHANDAVSAVARLLDLGLDRAALAATIRGSIAQRLVRRICPECTPQIGHVRREEGCESCANTGYHGRLPINEVAIFTPAMAEQIVRGAPTAALQREAVAAGMRTLRTTALERLARKETTREEVDRVVGDVPTTKVSLVADTPAPPVTAPVLVFVVDDDPVQRVLISATLERSGYRVAQARDGAEALHRIAGGEECGLLITDLQMPEMDGDALIRELRTNPFTAALPIVVLTGSDERESELIDAGADDYISKPVDPTRLLSRVRAALRRAA